MRKDGFKKQAFMSFLAERFIGFDGPERFYLCELTENLIDYAIAQYDVDAALDFLAGVMPDVTVGMVASFVDDVAATTYAKEEAAKWADTYEK